MKNNNKFRLKIDFEDIPIMDHESRINSSADIDELMNSVKEKLFGRKK